MSAYRFETADGDRFSVGDVAARWRESDLLAFRPPAVEEVCAAAATLQGDEPRHLVELLAGYPAFVPALAEEQRHALLIELLAGSTDDAVPWEVALVLQADRARQTRRFLERVLASGRHRTHRTRVIDLLAFLLEHPEARPITVEVMNAADDDDARAIVDELALDRDVTWP